ncbi:MAG: hypothetical protein K2I68_03875, partial [Bacteroidales bacterium]|nr:hypothetical protein [Bacteroidales bacterium]
ACLLDYVEGRLSAEAVQAVEVFLAENADWAAQVALLREPTAVVPDDCTCPPALKARLLRPKAGRVRYAAAAVVSLLLVAGIVRHMVARQAEASPAERRLVYSEWVRRHERQKIRKEVRREIRASLQVEDKDMQIIIL